MGGIVCLLCGVLAQANTSDLNITVTNWITPNPPSRQELASHVCVVEFWATWCPPCRDQVPHMKELAKKYADHNVIFVGISEDKSASTVKAFSEKQAINYNIGMDNGMSDRLAIDGIPTAFVVSHTGKILWSGHPAGDGLERAIDLAVRAAPRPLLEDVEMGRYSHLRLKLCGGKSFASAYSMLESRAKSCNCAEKVCACKVFGAVKSRLQNKVTAAQQIQDKDPKMAIAMYKEILDNFDGASITKQIEPAYLKLQRQIESQPAIAKQ